MKSARCIASTMHDSTFEVLDMSLEDLLEEHKRAKKLCI
ncbi:hypothetical protein J2Z32_004377 [Paenibacillus turicensis]|uniref:Uncharacterized protein n=1 Tax=Paenibacillus turicensis TaxID=160487 RepID=A0ABS4FYN8_9BACL|nr:hypothetical protein [Paenibacillus turicensis]